MFTTWVERRLDLAKESDDGDLLKLFLSAFGKFIAAPATDCRLFLFTLFWFDCNPWNLSIVSSRDFNDFNLAISAEMSDPFLKTSVLDSWKLFDLFNFVIGACAACGWAIRLFLDTPDLGSTAVERDWGAKDLETVVRVVWLVFTLLFHPSVILLEVCCGLIVSDRVTRLCVGISALAVDSDPLQISRLNECFYKPRKFGLPVAEP